MEKCPTRSTSSCISKYPLFKPGPALVLVVLPKLWRFKDRYKTCRSWGESWIIHSCCQSLKIPCRESPRPGTYSRIFFKQIRGSCCSGCIHTFLLSHRHLNSNRVISKMLQVQYKSDCQTQSWGEYNKPHRQWGLSYTTFSSLKRYYSLSSHTSRVIILPVQCLFPTPPQPSFSSPAKKQPLLPSQTHIDIHRIKQRITAEHHLLCPPPPPQWKTASLVLDQ